MSGVEHFHLTGRIANMSDEEQANLVDSISALYSDIQILRKREHPESIEDACDILMKIASNLAGFYRIAFGDMCENNCFVSTETLKANMENNAITFVDITMMKVIESCILHCHKMRKTSNDNMDLNMSLIDHGINLLFSVYAWIHFEVYALPIMTNITTEESVNVTIKKRVAQAAEGRYSQGRKLYERARNVARTLWDNGSPKDHIEMRDYLISEYLPTGHVKSPFANFNKDIGFSASGLLRELRMLAKELNRGDLIRRH